MIKKPSIWMEAIRSGLIGGAASLLLCLVGMVVEFSARYIISGVISMGQIFVIAPILIFGYAAAQRAEGNRVQALLAGAVAGLWRHWSCLAKSSTCGLCSSTPRQSCTRF
jgi:hypothetical protein